ncbi:hypothetical protein OD91_2268 [Lutibacter sp. Hel_I_33_5]|uniref:hypothetical protein n=1 Tax=Lutibacter sp. Hel_I_33_5 TaxID=1566289 RepID=UPI00119ED397|nr:hypothetical protein [Lutibacter sp. Hel_I_33_5]TVZ56964.1 hypothetical protein OD91_2268 [Lutibacter sp. Hel_I_33_5]
MINYIKRKDLNVKKYDACIEESIQSRIYAFSWYLDIVADNWDVLVLDAYEAVMPIPWKRKYFLKYSTQPYFCQQLGVFSKTTLSAKLQVDFINRIPNSFLKVSYQFNSDNVNVSNHFSERKNYILNLSEDYSELRKKYKKDRKYRVNQSLRNDFVIQNIEIDNLIKIAKEHYKFIALLDKDYLKLKKLMYQAVKTNNGFLLGVKDAGGCFFLKDKKRLIYLFSVMTPFGKEKQVPSLLLDSIIKEYSNSNYTLDFEGSMIPGVEAFYKSFGAEKEDYYLFEKSFL